MFTLKKATMQDHPLACTFLSQARAYQRAQGFVQWADNNPNEQTLAADIAAGKGYLLCQADTPIGYVYIDLTGEPAYDHLTDGAWSTDAPYAAVHRVAFGESARGKGASRPLFACIKALVAEHGLGVIRIDTHRDNKLMQHVLAREGFVYRGVVYYGTAERIAYELCF